MTDFWIVIEEMLRREEKRWREQQPVLEIPLLPEEEDSQHEVCENEPERGVVVVDFFV